MQSYASKQPPNSVREISKMTDLQLKQQFLVKKENFLHFNSHIDLNSKPLCLDFTTLNIPDIYKWY